MHQTFEYSTQLVETIMDNTDDGIILFSPVFDQQNEIVDLKYIFVNRAAEILIGIDREALLEKTILNTYTTHNFSNLFEAYKQAYLSEKEYRKEKYFTEDGLQKWYNISAKRCESVLLVTFNDISGFMALINEKSRSESLYRTLIRSLPHAEVALVDEKLNLLLSDGAALKAFGHQQKLQEKTNLVDILSAEEKEEVLPVLKACLKGKTKKLEMERESALYRLHFIPVKDDEHRIFAVLIVSEDIGIFNFSNDELRNKIYELENANESLEQFAYVASHDLQEPLRKIRAFGDRLQSKYQEQLDETAQDYINRMQNAAGRMQKLIDDLLKYSRVGRFQDPFQEVNLDELFSNIIEHLEERINDNHARVEVKTLPTVLGDVSTLEQLFTNLLTNALKFKKADQAPLIKVWSENVHEEGEARHQIYLQDNGIGFDEKYLDKIFNIFQRLHGRNAYEGTGIGLAICRKITEMHGGSISATAKLGEGATFIVTLPVISK
ncbi:PAS domain S-box-containing protein [Catalinimonas alkaloidigena]|uniref:ATP-binding protein n=1 Tax=Catalinimonas alkaloidigena TaxID=1075417 RepID=UPI0024056983|nr:ATP-binding protein [Catalinimonas alkaloidigena]MDF9796938.1 PAS domain S-box-containing protein [Catalinimonas alkaloidigena]